MKGVSFPCQHVNKQKLTLVKIKSDAITRERNSVRRVIMPTTTTLHSAITTVSNNMDVDSISSNRLGVSD